MTEVTSQQEGADAPREDEPETPVQQPPGESPESPQPSEPAAPEQPAEPPVEPGEDDDDAAGDAKAKPSIPASMTKGGRKRSASKKPKAKAKAKKAEPAKGKAKQTDEDKEKEEKKKLREEYTLLNKRFREDGTTTQMSRRMRFVAGKLERNVPKWAEATAGKKKDPDAPARIDNAEHPVRACHDGVRDGREGRRRQGDRR